MFRKENGVTLVALVITIIVLLILAGVTISMVMGDDSILGNAKKAADEYSDADIRGAIALAVNTVNTSAIAKKYGGSGNYEEFDATSVVTELTKLLPEAEVSATAVKVNGKTWTLAIAGPATGETIGTVEVTSPAQ